MNLAFRTTWLSSILLTFALNTEAIEIARLSDPVPSNEDREAKSVRVSGDGQSFAYQSESDYKNTGLAGYSDSQWHLWKKTLAFSDTVGGGANNELISDPNKPSDKDAEMVALDYSGNRACYTSDIPGEESIMLAEFASDGTKTITFVTNMTTYEGRDAFYCDISSDGSTIVFQSDAELVADAPVTKSKDQIYMTQNDGKDFTMVTPVEAIGTRSQGAVVSSDGSYVAFRSTMQSDSTSTESSKKDEAWLYRSSDAKLTRVTNFKDLECDTDLIYTKMIEIWGQANLTAEGVPSASIASCAYAAAQGWIPSSGTVGIGAVNQPKISGSGRFMSYTANFNAATVMGTHETQNVVSQGNLFLYDATLGFTWQITKEGMVGEINSNIEEFCCPGASSSKQRGACTTKNEMKGSCCWQKPCWFPALNSDISGDGRSITFVTDIDHNGKSTAINKDLEIAHYHIPTSTFTHITDTTDDTHDDVAPSISYDGDVVAFRSDFDYSTGTAILATNQVFAAKLAMGCSRNPKASNYLSTPDVEVCCEYDETTDVEESGTSVEFGFNGVVSDALSRVAFHEDSDATVKFCEQFVADAKADIACSLAIPLSNVKITSPTSADPCGDWIANGITVAFELLSFGLHSSESLRDRILLQYGDLNSSLWKGYLTKTLKAETPAPVGGCNVDDHHPENGGYFIEGIAGFGDGPDPQRPNRKITNSTWVPGGGYADGSLKYCTGRFCSEKCKTDGCPAIISGHTCSNIRFCYDADSTSDVWIMPDEKAMSTCDFSEATQLCTDTEGGDDDCCNFRVEEDADLKVYLFASKNGCTSGQKAAVQIDDYDDVGDACYNMGLTSSRIAKCTCNYEDSQMSTLSEPCHSNFIAGCNYHFPDLGDDTSCCETESCVGNHLNFEHPIGKAKEEARKKLCLDDSPGRCLNTITNVDDCCNQQCSSCGADVSPYNSWATCTTGNATTGNATCGYGGHGGRFSPFECDFSKCNADHTWHPDGDFYKNWMSTVDPEGWAALMATGSPVKAPVAAPVVVVTPVAPVVQAPTIIVRPSPPTPVVAPVAAPVAGPIAKTVASDSHDSDDSHDSHDSHDNSSERKIQTLIATATFLSTLVLF